MGKFFSEQEVRGVLIFLPLAAIGIAALLLVQPRYRPDEALRLEREQAAEEERLAHTDPAGRVLQLRPFDPNTVTFEELLDMGLTKVEARGIVNFRAHGMVYRIPEDVAICYSIDTGLYRRLKPMIRIGAEYAPKPHRQQPAFAGPPARELQPLAPFWIDTVQADYFYQTGLLTLRQAEAFIRYRNLHGIRNADELRASYMISDSLAEVLEPYVLYPERLPEPIDQQIDINRADSAELCRVVGIGPTTAGRIVAYRQRLGGFVSVEQLTEVRGITEANYEQILKQICCNSYENTKIDINFVRPEELAGHPYITGSALRKLLKQRQLKGGWESAEELVEDHILTRREAEKLAPYLIFRKQEAEPTEK